MPASSLFTITSGLTVIEACFAFQDGASCVKTGRVVGVEGYVSMHVFGSGCPILLSVISYQKRSSF